METRSKKPYCIGLPAGKSASHLPKKNRTGIEKYAVSTNSSLEYPSGLQSRGKSNLGPLDSPSPNKKQKQKIIKWTREEHKQVMPFFYETVNKLEI